MRQIKHYLDVADNPSVNIPAAFRIDEVRPSDVVAVHVPKHHPDYSALQCAGNTEHGIDKTRHIRCCRAFDKKSRFQAKSFA